VSVAVSLDTNAAFAAMVTRMDRDIGRLLDLLRARGVERRTLVMFISDNGPHQEGGADPTSGAQVACAASSVTSTKAASGYR
jgi:arylsulfatase A-like enzyme